MQPRASTVIQEASLRSLLQWLPLLCEGQLWMFTSIKVYVAAVHGVCLHDGQEKSIMSIRDP